MGIQYNSLIELVPRFLGDDAVENTPSSLGGRSFTSMCSLHTDIHEGGPSLPSLAARHTNIHVGVIPKSSKRYWESSLIFHSLSWFPDFSGMTPLKTHLHPYGGRSLPSMAARHTNILRGPSLPSLAARHTNIHVGGRSFTSM